MLNEADHKAANQITLNPSRVAHVLGVATSVLALASTVGKLAIRFFGLADLQSAVYFFDLNGEKNLPAFFPPFYYSSPLRFCSWSPC